MSNIRAIRAYSDRNPGLRLVTNVVPGSRNFPSTIRKLFTLACVVAFIGGAYHLVGGNAKNLWQVKPFMAMVCLTFILSVQRLGFRTTFTGFTSALFGDGQVRDGGLEHFNDHIGRWARRAAHIFAGVNLLMVLPTATDLVKLAQNMQPAVMGYIYALFLAAILPTRNAKDSGKAQFADNILPVVLIVGAYYLMNHIMK